jgi:PIN like domain
MRDLFPGFYNRTEEELSKLWQEGNFVFDTNMLLNIYRYAPKTRDRYFEILDLLKRRNQLWIPYQAAYEYQDRRMDVIRAQLDPYTKVGSILQTTWQTLDSALEPYKSKHGFIDTTELAEQLISTIKTAKDTVTQSSGKYKQYKQEN